MFQERRITMYHFDQIIDRTGTGSLKYDFSEEFGKGKDVLPMWVADMDFQTAPEILEALTRRVRHGIFGYTESKDAYFRAVQGWYAEHFQWEVHKSWLVKTPGVVFALAMAVRAFAEEGEGVLIQQPVYYPFGKVITGNGRKLVNNSLKLQNGHYEVDFEDFERKIAEEKVKLFLLCSPHNPVGRVWKEWELRRMGDLCRKYHVLVVSDEIHSDFVWQDHRHRVFASLSPEYEEMTVTCTAPSKTFNLAGLQVSNIFIPNRELRERFRREIGAVGYEEINTLGLLACQTAYESGAAWLLEVKKYIWDNFLFLKEFLARELPEVHVFNPEGTYLVWLDFREYGLSEEELEKRMVEKARLWLDRGAMFGKEGEGFERINIACPRETLKKALVQLKNVF